MRSSWRRWPQILFLTVFRPFMRTRLRPTWIGEVSDPLPGRPMLLVANHVSWWDGFLLLDLQRALRPRSRLRTVMLSRELRRFPFLRLIGGVGLEPGSPTSLRRLLRHLGAVWRAEPASVLAFFPQGRIWPAFKRPLGFKPGIRRFAGDAAPCTVIPVGLHLEPLNRMSPTAFVTMGAPILVTVDQPLEPQRLEAAIEDSLDQTARMLSELGEDAVR